MIQGSLTTYILTYCYHNKKDLHFVSNHQHWGQANQKIFDHIYASHTREADSLMETKKIRNDCWQARTDRRLYTINRVKIKLNMEVDDD